jgi:hypothetical protein
VVDCVVGVGGLVRESEECPYSRGQTLCGAGECELFIGLPLAIRGRIRTMDKLYKLKSEAGAEVDEISVHVRNFRSYHEPGKP